MNYEINDVNTQNNNSNIDNLKIIATFLRKDALELILSANNGHIGGCLSSVELLTAMYFGGIFHFDINNPKNPFRDKILVRGHLGPIRYPIFSLLGYIQRSELTTYRQLGSRLQGHEDMHEMPGVDITPSGSLGMLLSYGVGSAIESKYQGKNNKVILFLGDGEEQEGNVSEAARHASSLGLDNLICIIDKNGKQLSRSTIESDASSDLETIWKGYGWDVEVINDGHNIEEILSVYKKIQNIKKQTVIIAHTIKGYGVSDSEKHFSGYHTLSTVSDVGIIKEAIKELKKELECKNVTINYVTNIARKNVSSIVMPMRLNQSDIYLKTIYDIEYSGPSGINLEKGQAQFFRELRKRIERILDNSFYIITPDLIRKDILIENGMDKFSHFIDTGIREQHAIAMAHGISVENPKSRIYVCYGDAFLYRAMDQINAAAQGKSNILISGENSGIFQGQNGKTHQSIGQSGGMLYMPGVTFYEPSDIIDLYNVYSKVLSENQGISYVRFHRGTVNLERNSSDKKSTDAYYVHKPDTIKFTIIASGFMVENAVIAAKKMEIEYGISTAVINVVNHNTLKDKLPSLLENDAPILTLYNGNPDILKNLVSGIILDNYDISRPKAIKGHGFFEGTSGSVQDLIKFYNLDPDGILKISMKFINNLF